MNRFHVLALSTICLLGFVAPAMAQSRFSPDNGDPNQVPGVVLECVDSQGKATTVTANCPNPATVSVRPSTGTGAYSPSRVIGTAPSQILAAGYAKSFIDLRNICIFPSTCTATIVCNFGGVPSNPPVPGDIILYPGSRQSFESSFILSDALQCYATAASTPFTVGAK